MLVIGQLKMKNYWGLRVGLNKRKNKQTNFPQRLRVKVLPLQRAYEAAR